MPTRHVGEMSTGGFDLRLSQLRETQDLPLLAEQLPSTLRLKEDQRNLLWLLARGYSLAGIARHLMYSDTELSLAIERLADVLGTDRPD